jgi:pimeloyl-ACP methyl ester carboxylesterase
MRVIDLSLDVAEIVGRGEPADLAASLHLPDALPDGGVIELLVCIHGGSYTRNYWTADFAGFAGYNFAAHMTARGYAVAALDMLGMGESAKPEPESILDRAKIAAANDHAARTFADGLRNGRWARADHVVMTGIGHSIGGMMAITQQARHRSFQRLAILGWSNQPLALSAEAIAMLKSHCVEHGYAAPPRTNMRAFFYGKDVPMALVEADEALASRTPSCLLRDSLTPDIVHAEAAAVQCPVFIAQGSIDTSPNPHREVPLYAGSRDVTLMMMDDTAHCHNFEPSRHRLWNRLDGWIGGLPME